MALGRSLRKTLIIDSGKPCNRSTPHAHNFITHDGESPAAISSKAKAQVLEYPTVKFVDATVVAIANGDRFEVTTDQNETYTARKVLFATGVKDTMSAIQGFAQCWGISILHCPYCHGYEVSGKNTGIIANGDTAYDLCTLIQHWTDQLTLFTNGSATISPEQRQSIEQLGIHIIEDEIEEIVHESGMVKKIRLNNKAEHPLEAIYARVNFTQHCPIPLDLGCAQTDSGHIAVDMFNKTNVDNIYAAGDNTTPFRSLAYATSEGSKAGAIINKELITEDLSH